MGFDSKQCLRDGSTNLTASVTAPAASGANKGPISLMTGLPRHKPMWLKAYVKAQVTGTNAVTTIHSTTPPTGGTYSITINNITVSGLAFSATTATVQAAIVAAVTAATPLYLNGRFYPAIVGGTDLTVSGAAIGTGDMVFTFAGVLQAQPVFAQMSINVTLLTGQTATVLQSTTAGMDIAITATDAANPLQSVGTLHINGATIPFSDQAVLLETGPSFNVNANQATAGPPLTSVNYQATVTGTPVVAGVIIYVDDWAGGLN